MNLRQLVKYLFWRDTTFHGEFRALWRLAGASAARAIVDVGSNDGFYGSNSYPFVARGWRALLIEPHPTAFAQLQARHASRANATCLNVACGEASGALPLWCGEDGDATLATFRPEWHPHFQDGKPKTAMTVAVRRLDEVLAEHRFPPHFGVLSVDTEGWDWEVLKGLSLTQWHPQCIVTEDGEPEATAAKAAYLQTHGYSLRRQIDANAFWARTGEST